ncbi:MAG: hypothetical protein F4Y62_01230 [Rhodospirillaceae bacterium]|nr:hypothetical protein [Rhodospirillaceae bacterium]
MIDAGELADSHLIVKRSRASLAGFPPISVGTKPVDNGHYIFDADERGAFIAREPRAAEILRPFVGGQEYINGRQRWLLHVSDESPATLRSLPAVMERIGAVRRYREKEAGRLGRSLADRPTAYHVSVLPDAPFLAIPEVSSERRTYVPIGWLEPPCIPSNQLLVVRDAGLWLFGLLASKMHMAWLRHVGGRLKSDYRYSSGLVYNTFPLPSKDTDLSRLEPLAQAVLAARAAHPGTTLADLYDPDLMPPNLRRAHGSLDRAVDWLYRPAGFASERERVEHLFMRYEALSAPLGAQANAKHKRTERRKPKGNIG